jgi:hypothetical protein
MVMDAEMALEAVEMSKKIRYILWKGLTMHVIKLMVRVNIIKGRIIVELVYQHPPK